MKFLSSSIVLIFLTIALLQLKGNRCEEDKGYKQMDGDDTLEEYEDDTFEGENDGEMAQGGVDRLTPAPDTDGHIKDYLTVTTDNSPREVTGIFEEATEYNYDDE